jgi:hypothetical protein
VIGGALGVAMGWAILKALMNLMPKYTLPSEAEAASDPGTRRSQLCHER